MFTDLHIFLHTSLKFNDDSTVPDLGRTGEGETDDFWSPLKKLIYNLFLVMKRQTAVVTRCSQ